MPRKPHSLQPHRDRVPFDISRSSYFRHVSAERDEIKRHQREVSVESGKDVEFGAALMSWVRRHRWEWADERARRHPEA